MPAPLVSDEGITDALAPEFTFVRRLGVGGQRVVCLVERNGKQQVLKLMNPDASERAEREVAAAQKFDHPGLSTVQSDLAKISVEGSEYIYFLEEFVEGEALDGNAQLELCDALRLGAELIDAAEYLYARHHLVHRDIKPPNIIRRPDGTFVLLDVGVARHQDLDTLTAFNAPHGPGTAGHLAPEQLVASKGHDLDSRADQFAIAIVMFELLSGRLPFDPSSGSYRTLLMTGTVGNWEGVPDVVRPLLARMLQPKPHRRYRPGSAAVAFAQMKEEAGCS